MSNTKTPTSTAQVPFQSTAPASPQRAPPTSHDVESSLPWSLNRNQPVFCADQLSRPCMTVISDFCPSTMDWASCLTWGSAVVPSTSFAMAMAPW